MRNPNGYGSIVKLSGNRRKPFGVRITVGYKSDGTQIYKYLGYYETRKEAMLSLASYNENPYSLEHDKLTFKDIYDKWSVKGLDGLAKTSQTTYTGAFKHCKSIYDIKFKKLNTLYLQKVIDDIEAPTSKHATKLLFKQLYKYAMKNDIVSKNYSRYLEVEKPKIQKERKPFTNEEIKLLWDNVDIENVDIILMLIYSGFRVTELLELKKENIFLEERYMIGGKKTEAGINRIVPIHKKILPFFEKRMKDTHLFSSKKGGKLLYDNFLKYQFRPIMKDLNMVHHIHDTRHTFISLMDNAAVNKLTLKRIVGHSSKDITDRYTHKDINELLKEIDKI